MGKPRQGRKILSLLRSFRPMQSQPTAIAVGYFLAPLRGWESVKLLCALCVSVAKPFGAGNPNHSDQLERGSEASIPTGLRPPARGCEARATPGHRPEKIPNRKAVAANPFPNACATVSHNPVGVVRYPR